MDNINVRTQINHLPGKPGVYLFKDINGRIIYVGKAKNLKKRVSSYFDKKHYDSYKTRVLVNQIYSIDKIIVDNESDAYLLENNLIKEHQPKYNILLKDDKSFPWICIKNEPFPRIFSTRNVIKDKSIYFGPYTSAYMVKTLLNLIRQLYPLRNCNLNLTDENIKKKKFRVCLEYHIGNCKGPCEGYQSRTDYNTSIDQIKNILKGDIREVIQHLENLMNEYAHDYKFEEAENIKQKRNLLQKYKSKSTIVNPKISNVDVFGFIDDDKKVYVNYLKVIDGAIVQSHSMEIKRKLEEAKEEIMGLIITDIRQRLNSQSKEIILPFMPVERFKGVKYAVPQMGDRKKLLDLSIRNAKYFKNERFKQREQVKENYKKKEHEILNELKETIGMDKMPEHIECFDNSNLQGSNPVASCVVFKNGKPCKNEYRKFNIKSVEGPDDYASMREIVYRRYDRALNENVSLPDLIIVDGGKGQLNAAIESLKQLSISGQIEIIGIAKRLEEIFKPGDNIPLYIDKNSRALKLIQKIRDEAHRFGIQFHRDKRSLSMLHSKLEDIKGIGPKTIEKLIGKYKTIENIKKLSVNEIAKHVGLKKAKDIKNYL